MQQRMLVSVTALALAAGLVSTRAQAPFMYAITGARLVPVSGPPVEAGTIVVRDGFIAAVGARAEVPPDAVQIDGKGLTVYPGLIDLGSGVGLEVPPAPRADNPQTTEDVERVKSDYLLRAHLRAADHVNPRAPALARWAAAGITSVLATPPGDAFRGQSALINTALPPDEPQVGALADERAGAMVVRSPVALHVSFPERPAGGDAYPNSLMGVIAFVRQAFVDAQHDAQLQQRAARLRPGDPRPVYRAAFEGVQPALAGRLPVAFEASSAREIRRALEMAREFGLSAMISGGLEADQVSADLKAADARLILSLNYPARPTSLAPDADEPLRVIRQRTNAPSVAVAIDKAGIPFAFASAGLTDPKDFVKNVGKAVEAGLSKDAALRGLTLGAAAIAGAAGRLGSLEVGKVANLLAVEGDLFDEKVVVKHVFVDGRPVNLNLPPETEGRPRRPSAVDR